MKGGVNIILVIANVIMKIRARFGTCHAMANDLSGDYHDVQIDE